jgi:hypothetical protein
MAILSKRFYVTTRDLHLYVGLFLSPFVTAFALSVIFLAHAWVPGGSPAGSPRVVRNLVLSPDLERLTGREQVDALRKVLDGLGVTGEIGYVRRVAKEHRLAMPVSIPGRETTVELDLPGGTATVVERKTGWADAMIYLHKMPGPHNANIRGNAPFLKVWRWVTDATVYLALFLSISGIYLWAVLKAERRIGLGMIAAGALSFFGLVYVIVR